MKELVLTLPKNITFENASQVDADLSRSVKSNKPRRVILDFRNVSLLDSAGAAIVNSFSERIKTQGIEIFKNNTTPEHEHTLNLFTVHPTTSEFEIRDPGAFETLGESVYTFYDFLKNGVFLLADVFYWTIVAFFRKKLRRRGEVIHQSVLIGVNALPIIALIAFLIGFILALQSAVQLRQFGANIYVADLVAVAMVSEMGPLITAIMVAGRSGSAIAAEIASMVVSEEIDSLKVMGIDPIPYLIVPKLLAIIMTLPMLTLFANIIGIIGGMVIGITYLDIDIIPFYNAVVSVLRYKEFITAFVKSLTFAVIILLTGAHFGLRVKGGAEGVGRATTASVVFSIFLVIVADSIIGLVFYFGGSTF